MNKKFKYLIFLLFFSLLFNCSFDRKSGIWSGSEKEKVRLSKIEKTQKEILETIKVYSSDTTFSEEILPKKEVILSNPKQNLIWVMPGLNLQNNTSHIYLTSIKNKFLKKKIGKNKFSISQIMQSPLSINNNIIFSDDTGTIFNISNAGKVNWKKNIYKKVYKKIYKNLAFSIYNRVIYVADNIGFVYAVNLENGKVIWIKNHGIPFKSKIKVYKNKMYVIDQDNRLLSFNIKEGTKIWDVRTITSFIKSQTFLALAISKNGKLIMINSSGDLLKVDARKGSINWALNTTDTSFAHDTDFFKTSDAVIDKNNVIFSTASSIYSFKLDSGLINWKKNIGSTNTPVVDNDNIFFVTDNGYFLNINKNSGEITWSTNVLKVLKKRKRKTNISGFIMGSGKIYITTFNGHLIVCSASSGKVEYSKKIADSINTSPIISNNSLLILTGNSRILGFN